MGIASALGILSEALRFLECKDFGSNSKDIIAISDSVSKSIDILQYCQNIIDKRKVNK